MLNDTSNFPIQIQHNNDDHSLTYSSPDSSIDGEEDASVFSLDGMNFDQEESEEHFVGNPGSGTSSPSSSFVELEQSIHELEKCYAQCIKSSPQKGTAMNMLIPIFPIQIQHNNDDHSLTYSSPDSSIDGEEDASVFSLDGMNFDQEESEEHFVGNPGSGTSSPSSSFVELEQSIHELEKCYAQCIKSSPQKGTAMNMLIPIFPIQIQHNNDDHSLTYSSPDSSIDGEEDASVFSLDGMNFDQEESEEHFVGNPGSGTSSPSSSFVELEQSIHELEKCYAQFIKSSPQKGTAMNMLIPIFPIQIQHNNDDHSLTYSSADSSMSGGEDASVFSLDGMIFDQEEEHFVGNPGSGTSSPSSSFVELEQRIHELEKYYAQYIKSSPQKESFEEDGVMIDAKVLLNKRKEAKKGDAIHFNHGDQPRLACAKAPLDLGEVELLAKQKEMLFKRQCLHQGGARSQYYSVVSVLQREEGNATKDEVTLKNIFLPATSSGTRASNKSELQTYVHHTQQRYRVSNDFDLEG
ncbi:predicted protein [Chaetoceros tenuissimus]|uniref:Uncharacterized protein n=1 Tax=Chaetoceros tenuissimus TaxID=426638 RepID=A0AAD3D177_9STRA|nr:predicted protein [Chaetoceros tenuissimus]